MAYNISNKNSYHLYDPMFEKISDTELVDWYQFENNSESLLVEVNAEDDFDISNEKAVKFGYTNNNPSNGVFLVGKKFFKYDPVKVYTVAIRIKTNTDAIIKAGFIGLTSRPYIMKPLYNTDYINEIVNYHRFTFGHDGVINISDITALEHYAPINKYGEDDLQFHEYVGYISGTTASEIIYSETLGLDVLNPVPMREECDYFAPFIKLENHPVGKYTVIDYFYIDDKPILDYQASPIVPVTELVNNIGAYNDGGYIFENYVADGYFETV